MQWRMMVAMVVLGTVGSGRLIAAEDSASENWPAWRGDGSGVSQAKNLPLAWSETENVVWRTPLPGEGNSSPIVWGSRLFLTAALEDGAKRFVLCLDAHTGKLLWNTELLPGLKTTLYPKTGFAAPTPTTDGQRVYAFFDAPGLVALDMQGNVVWKQDLGPFDAPYNMGTSTVLYKDTVIQSCDHRKKAFIVALDRISGKERWRTERKSSGFGHFGTPLLIHVQGRPQLVVNGELVVAYDPDSGKELWSCRGMKECVGPSTVFGHGLVYASSGRTGPVMAIDPTGQGDVTETHVRMHLTSGGPYVPTPLVYPHLLIPGDNGRMLFYAGPSRRMADERVRDHFTSSPVGGDGKIYWCSERGKTYVIDAAGMKANPPSFKVLAINQLRGPILATPAIAHGRLYVRTNEAIYCIAEKAKTPQLAAPKAITGTFEQLRDRYNANQAFWQNEAKAQIRLETLEAIARLDDPQVIPFLLFIAQKEPHWDICEEAAKSLGRKGRPAIDSLIVLLPDSRPFIRTIAIQSLGRLRATQAVAGILKATGDKQALVRSVSMQALAQIGQDDTVDRPQIVAVMLECLADREGEEAVVRESALEGLATLAPKIGAQRGEVVRTLGEALGDRNPRLAGKSQKILAEVYKVLPAEIEKMRPTGGEGKQAQ